MPALQALTGVKLLFSPCNPFSAFYAYSGAAAPSNALSRRVVGLCPTPHFLLCQKEAKIISAQSAECVSRHPANFPFIGHTAFV